MEIRYIPYDKKGLVCYGIVPTALEARYVLRDMRTIVERYGFVSVADLKELLNVDYGYRDNNYGWHSVQTLRIREETDGSFGIYLKEAMPIKKRTNSPSRIFESIKAYDKDHEYLCIIMGRVGPTGKTWLCDRLKDEGYTAVELTEDVYTHVDYVDNANHVMINSDKKTITVILNESYKKEL